MQSVHVIDPATDDFPEAQSTQTEDELAPTVEEARSAPQEIQVSEDCPVAVLYLPAMQDTQVSDDCAVAVLYLPAMQLVHSDAPATADHVPAGQAAQVSAV